jgi:hypothetical protein
MSLHLSSPQGLTRKDVLALLVLLALVLVFFWKLAFTNLIVARGDIFYYFYPYRDFAAQAVRADASRCGIRICSWVRRSWPTARSASSIRSTC